MDGDQSVSRVLPRSVEIRHAYRVPWPCTSSRCMLAPLATFYVNERRNGLEPEDRFGDETFVHANQPNPDLDEDPVWLDP